MVRAIEPWEEAAREQTQRLTIDRRQRFLKLNSPTQNKIISLLEKMDEIIQKKSWPKAQAYFFKSIPKNLPTVGIFDLGKDKNGVHWTDVDNQIKDSCFSDSDMEGLTLVPRRVESELAAFKSLAELSQEKTS